MPDIDVSDSDKGSAQKRREYAGNNIALLTFSLLKYAFVEI
jgi:hypothetical protein